MSSGRAMSENGKELCVGFILFNPSESLLSRVELSVRNGFHVYVFDNSPEKDGARKLAEQDPANITYATCGRNVGLGAGLAYLCAQAYYQGFRALLFFDQDTGFSAETLTYIRDFRARNAHFERNYSAIVFQGGSGGPADRSCRDVSLAINSGSLYFLENLMKIGWHNPEYFVDCVDYEFCMSSAHHGFKISECRGVPGFDHVSEQADELHNFFGRPKPMRAYPLPRIMGSVTATSRLLLRALLSFDLRYFRVIGLATAKYLFIQAYVRVALLFGF